MTGMCSCKSSLMAALVIFASCALITLSFSAAAARAAVLVEKAWDCSNGFSCSSETLGLCKSSLQPYLPMSSTINPYALALVISKPGAYKCNIKVTANHFDFPEGATDEPDETTEVFLNGVSLGKTEDRWCQPGSVPCANPQPCTSYCSSMFSECMTKADANGCSYCDCPCQSYAGNATNALLSGNIQPYSLGPGQSICFRVRPSGGLTNLRNAQDKATAFALAGTGNRHAISVRIRNGFYLEPRAWMCLDCSCSWCSTDQESPDNRLEAKENEMYKITLGSDGLTVTFSAVSENINIVLPPEATTPDIIHKYHPSGFQLNAYCDNNCVWKSQLGAAYSGYPAVADVVERVACSVTKKVCGASCTSGSECESGQCTGGVCFNCCGDYSCQSGETYTCPEDCGGEPECRMLLESCSDTQECCEGLTCSTGRCRHETPPV